jgi:endonuclease G, mitochondrial
MYKKVAFLIFTCIFSLQVLFAQVAGVVVHSPKDSSWAFHLTTGTPYDFEPSDDLLILRPQYVLSYCTTKNTANWVAWQLNADWYGTSGRFQGNFMTDPLLPDDVYHVRHRDYTNSGFDRGHIVRSEERTSTPEDNKSTFYLTNVLPQTPDLNRGVWLNFEYYCEHLCKQDNKTLYVYAGGVFHSDSTLKGEGKVAIPDSCFKILLILDDGQDISSVSNETLIIAVMMPNIQGVRRDKWQQYITTVRRIEESTGYNFFSAFSEELQDMLETRAYEE